MKYLSYYISKFRLEDGALCLSYILSLFSSTGDCPMMAKVLVFLLYSNSPQTETELYSSNVSKMRASLALVLTVSSNR